MDQKPTKTIADIQDQVTPVIVDEDDLEINDDFDYSNYAVVRGEFFSHIKEPSISFSDMQFSANSAAVNKMPNTDYIQILISPDTNKLLVRAAHEDDKDSFVWVSYRKKDGKRIPKKVTCKIFSAKLFDQMGWDPSSRYKFLGKMIQSQGELFFAFDLLEPEVFQREISPEGNPKRLRVPKYIEEWKDQFGIPLEEHKKLQVTTFDGYAVFTISDKKPLHPADSKNAAEETPSIGAETNGTGGPDVFRTI